MFHKAATLEGVTFAGHAWFKRAELKSVATFSNVTFDGGAIFSHATFAQSASFNGSSFFGWAIFSRARFEAEADFGVTRFELEAIFLDAEFKGNTSFMNSAFFKSASFGGRNTSFGSRANFRGTSFNQAADFQRVRFAGDTNFDLAVFDGRVIFKKAVFGQLSYDCVIAFTDCQFQKPTSFRKATFHSRYPDFSGAVPHDKTTFTDHPDNWPKGTQSDPVQAKASCAVIRHNLGKQGLPEAEHFFYRREMGFGRQIGGFWERLPFRLYDWLSGYGYSIERPVWGMLWLWVVPGLIFGAAGVTGARLADLATLLNSLGLSFANMFSFLGLQRTFFQTELDALTGAFQALAGFQTVMGFVLLFFLGLGLRNRFRLK